MTPTFQNTARSALLSGSKNPPPSFLPWRLSQTNNKTKKATRPIRFLLWASTITTSAFVLPSVIGTCIVKNEHGISVSLDSLPVGVIYDPVMDELTCKHERSCEQWSISQCAVVKCLNRYACQSATLMDNQAVSCYDYGACQQANFPKAHSIFCGMDHLLSCNKARMEVDRTLVCVGRHACVSSNASAQMVVRVPADSAVRCGYSGGDAFSCQYMLIYVPHAKHACFTSLNNQASSLSSDQHCAVVCDVEAECDKATIHFRVE
ncbi:hypothetical protein ACA910_011195 [Epithemia clementina (nom. ined.)]